MSIVGCLLYLGWIHPGKEVTPPERHIFLLPSRDLRYRWDPTHQGRTTLPTTRPLHYQVPGLAPGPLAPLQGHKPQPTTTSITPGPQAQPQGHKPRP